MAISQSKVIAGEERLASVRTLPSDFEICETQIDPKLALLKIPWQVCVLVSDSDELIKHACTVQIHSYIWHLQKHISSLQLGPFDTVLVPTAPSQFPCWAVNLYFSTTYFLLQYMLLKILLQEITYYEQNSYWLSWALVFKFLVNCFERTPSWFSHGGQWFEGGSGISYEILKSKRGKVLLTSILIGFIKRK